MQLYVYDLNCNYRAYTELLTSLKYKCSLDKPCQELTFSIPYSVYSDAFPRFYIETGCKVEMYDDNTICRFRGKVEITSVDMKSETMTCTCYDYIRILMKCKVTYNFSNITAYQAVATIFNDLQIPYSEKGIFGGIDGDGGKITINHLVKNRSAYEVCMMIATELHNNLNNYYYIFMDVAGNVNLMECDKYWSKQTIKPCTSPSLANPDGNIISFSYKEDASNIVNKILLYDSKGNRVDFNTGEIEEVEEDDEDKEESGE